MSESIHIEDAINDQLLTLILEKVPYEDVLQNVLLVNKRWLGVGIGPDLWRPRFSKQIM